MHYDIPEYRYCETVLLKNGWVKQKRSSSSHVKFKKDGKYNILSDHGKNVNPMIWRRLIKENDLTLYS